jgi:chromosome segregation ATPase
MPKITQGNSLLERLSVGVAEFRETLMQCIFRMEARLKEATDLAAREAKKIEETIESFQATVRLLEAQLQEKEQLLHKESLTLEELNKTVKQKILDLENLIREKEDLLLVRDAELRDLQARVEVLEASSAAVITLTEEDEVSPREEKSLALEKQAAAELERYRAEIQEKDILLKASETEVRMVKQSMEKKIKELETIVKRQAGQRPRTSRLVSLIGTIEKKN